MKSKYVFIRNWPTMEVGDFVYSVWVGSSRRELAKLFLLREYCQDCGLFLQKNSWEVCSQLEQAKEKFRKDGNQYADPFRHASINVSDLYRMIVDDSLNAFEAKQVETKSSLWWNFHDDPEFVQTINKLNVTQNASPSRRKNLSPRKRVKRHEVELSSLTL